MGYKISNLASLPENDGDFHVFIIGEGGEEQLAWVTSNFDQLAKDIGPRAVVVQGHNDQLTHEIVSLVRKYSNENSEAVLFQGLFLFVSEGHPQTTMKQVYVFPLTSTDLEAAESVEYMAEVVGRVVGAIRSGTFSEMAADESRDTFTMHYGGGLVFKFLKSLNDIIELKPNVVGFGINFNAMIEAKLKRYERSVD